MSSPETSARRLSACQSGLAMVEFVITVPLVMFVLIATAEIGRALYQYTALTKAVRDGARYLATAGFGTSGNPLFEADLPGVPGDLTKARNVTVFGSPVVTAQSRPVLPGFTVANVTPRRVGTTDYVEVAASYTFQPLFIPIPGLGLGTSNVAAISTMNAVATHRYLR